MEQKNRPIEILFFDDDPTIGYCQNCKAAAVYVSTGLTCPMCKDTDLSIFVWDKESKYPEC